MDPTPHGPTCSSLLIPAPPPALSHVLDPFEAKSQEKDGCKPGYGHSAHSVSTVEAASSTLTLRTLRTLLALLTLLPRQRVAFSAAHAPSYHAPSYHAPLVSSEDHVGRAPPHSAQCTVQSAKCTLDTAHCTLRTAFVSHGSGLNASPETVWTLSKASFPAQLDGPRRSYPHKRADRHPYRVSGFSWLFMAFIFRHRTPLMSSYEVHSGINQLDVSVLRTYAVPSVFYLRVYVNVRSSTLQRGLEVRYRWSIDLTWRSTHPLHDPIDPTVE